MWLYVLRRSGSRKHGEDTREWCNDRLERADKVNDRFFRFVCGDKNLEGWRIDAQLHHSVPM